MLIDNIVARIQCEIMNNSNGYSVPIHNIALVFSDKGPQRTAYWLDDHDDHRLAAGLVQAGYCRWANRVGIIYKQIISIITTHGRGDPPGSDRHCAGHWPVVTGVYQIRLVLFMKRLQ